MQDETCKSEPLRTRVCTSIRSPERNRLVLTESHISSFSVNINNRDTAVSVYKTKRNDPYVAEVKS